MCLGARLVLKILYFVLKVFSSSLGQTIFAACHKYFLENGAYTKNAVLFSGFLACRFWMQCKYNFNFVEQILILFCVRGRREADVD
eukprot:snap_masked-scaffold_1-processed-gene-27.23-mRNA-1 protein AED:1.00 eAED:1.00 QI:0/0/0/0/1/1/2/0/85